MRSYRTTERKINGNRGDRNGMALTEAQAFERGRQAAIAGRNRARHAYAQPQIVAAFERGYDSVITEQRERKEAGK